MSGRKYQVWDVFTDQRLAGNPLAVILEAEGLDQDAMQRVAREFNLSESTFILPPEKSGHRARVRIFTPDYEMPFAGHPTVGSAIAIADEGSSLVVLEENIGPVRCVVERDGGWGFAEFDLPQLPKRLDFDGAPEAVGAALGLSPHEIGFENHQIQLWSAGVPYVTVPVAGLRVASKVVFDNAAWMKIAPAKGRSVVPSAYVYSRETGGHDNAFHARMFVPGTPSYEDPATGSAAAAFAGAVVHFDQPVDGTTQLWIEQGIEMRRPSRLKLELQVEAGGLAAARIGGHAVKVLEGMLII